MDIVSADLGHDRPHGILGEAAVRRRIPSAFTIVGLTIALTLMAISLVGLFDGIVP